MQKCFFFLIVKNIAFMRLMKKQILPSVSFIPFDLSLFINLLFFRFFFHLMEKNNNNEDSSATMIITGWRIKCFRFFSIFLSSFRWYK